MMKDIRRLIGGFFLATALAVPHLGAGADDATMKFYLAFMGLCGALAAWGILP